MLQQRGERLIAWLTVVLWALAVLQNAELLQPARETLARMVSARLTVGAFSISLRDVLAFAFTVWLSFQFSRFTRFVLEEDVYPRVRLARGLPYAFSNILHYTILLIGFFIALAASGLNLDRFALLAGAFGVGIGFGLQNVVNNFVSGLILLFERPIQVGDTVQIGSVTGEVRHIGIRSSTLRTFDGAEVIVPNGTFISDMVTNWTLSDRLRRIDIILTVAHNSEPEQVLELLTRVAAAHPLVLEHPPPTALLTSFSDTALTLELRCWTDRFEQWTLIRSQLAISLSKALHEAEIAVLPSLAPTAGAQVQIKSGSTRA
jgi:small-conductance mechanosensitive channel